jgi:hypothetical protein
VGTATGIGTGMVELISRHSKFPPSVPSFGEKAANRKAPFLETPFEAETIHLVGSLGEWPVPVGRSWRDPADLQSPPGLEQAIAAHR